MSVSTVYFINPDQLLYETMNQAFQLHARVGLDFSVFYQPNDSTNNYGKQSKGFKMNK